MSDTQMTIALLAVSSTQADSLLYILEQAAESIPGLFTYTNKADSMGFFLNEIEPCLFKQ